MATKKSAPAKKAAPVKKQSKPAVKAAAKAAPKSARPAGGKAATVKTASKAAARPASGKTASAKSAGPSSGKKVAVKAAPKKAVPVKFKSAPKPARSASVKPAVVKTTAKAAPKKAAAPASVKATPAKAKVTEKAAPVKAGKKAPGKAAPKKEQSLKPPVVPKLTTKSAVKYQPDFTKSILDTPKNEQVKPVVRYSDSDLQEFKEIILRKLDAAKKELAYLQGLITRRDEGGDMDEGRYMTMEDGSVSMEREQLSQLASRQITFIDHLEKALMRVENKTYGICRVTGNLIDKARLRAVPHATLSMEAKTTMNK